MKKRITVFACLLVLTLLFVTACGQPSGDSDHVNNPADASDITSNTVQTNGVDTQSGETVDNDAQSGETVENDTQTGETVENDTQTGETISVNPADYGIADPMEMRNVSELSLEALGAYYLHTDGAMAESSADELYQRFLSDPDAVLTYLSRLGGQPAREGESDTALEVLCKAIASTDVFLYDATDAFTNILTDAQTRNETGSVAAVVECLRNEYAAALERYQEYASLMPPTDAQ